MGTCSLKQDLKNKNQQKAEGKRKLIYQKTFAQNTAKNYTFESQRTIKTEHVIVAKELPAIPTQVSVFSRVYTVLDQYKQIQDEDDVILTVQHNILGQVRHARFVKKTKDNEKWIQNLLKQHMDHPNILKIYEYYREKENHIIVQELVQGAKLGEHTKSNESTTETQAASFVMQMLLSIQYLHNNNIVHGRISQTSFQFMDENTWSTLKLVDYKNIFCKPELDVYRMSYLAPELITIVQEEKFTKEGDIWGCGIICYQLLNEVLPYSKCKTTQQMQNQVLRGAISFDSTNFDKISGAAKNFVKKILNRLVTQRPTPLQLLNDPWLAGITTVQKEQAKDTFQQFTQQKKKINKLQYHILVFMINMFFSQSFNQKISSFNEFDLNKDGRVTMQEMLQVYSQVEDQEVAENAKQQVRQIFETIDTDGSGDIDFVEFLVAITDKRALLTQSHLNQAFQILNTSKNGKLSESELSTQLQITVEIVREHIPQELISKTGKVINFNNKASFDLKRFKDFMLSLI